MDWTDASAVFSDKNAGTDKKVTITGLALAGTKAANYTLSSVQTETTATISPKNLNITAAATNRTYDGTVTVAVTGTVEDGSVVSGDEVSFGQTTGTMADKSAGQGKAVTGIVFTLSGADSANYTANIVNEETVTVDIAKKEIGIDWSETKFTYDGTVHTPKAEPTGVVERDELAVSVTGGQTHANAYTDTTAYTATAAELTGTDKDNYRLPDAKSADSDLTTLFTIDQRLAELAWTNTIFTYDGAGHLPQATVANPVGTGTAKDICTVTVNSGTGVIDAGTYTMTATALSNADYKLPDAAADKQTTVTVNPKQLTTGMISLDSTDNTYAVTHEAIMPAVTVTDYDLDSAQGGRKLTLYTSGTDADGIAGDYSISGETQATDYGSHVLTVTGRGNYTGTVDVTWYVTDPNAPEGTIEISENKWTKFWNSVTFGKFFNKTQTVTITGSEDASESGVSEICYYLSDTELAQEALQALTDADWKKLDTGKDETGATKKSGSFKMDPDSRQIVYARITDASGNMTYLNSEGVTLDATNPVITGVTDGATYCEAQTVTVTDTYLKTVTIRTYGKDADGTTGDGKNTADTALTTTVYSADAEDAAHMFAADGTYTLPAVNGKVTVTAEDLAGNITEITVTVNDGHTFTDYVRSDNASTQQNATETAKCEFCDATDTREIAGTKLRTQVETVTIAEETEENGKIITAVNVDKALPKTEISNMTAALAKSLLTDEEQTNVQAGATVKIYLDVTDIDDTVSDTDKALTESAITTLGGDSHVGMYLDLSLFKQINNNPATRLTSSGASMISVSVAVPESLRSTDSAYTRTYNVVRIHDGKAEFLNPSCEDYVLIFETDKFSTYAIVYTDTAVPAEPGTDTTTETSTTTTTATTTEASTTTTTATTTEASTTTTTATTTETSTTTTTATTTEASTTTTTVTTTETSTTTAPAASVEPGTTTAASITTETTAQTGDSADLALWISVLLLAAAGIVIMTEVRRKRR